MVRKRNNKIEITIKVLFNSTNTDLCPKTNTRPVLSPIDNNNNKITVLALTNRYFFPLRKLYHPRLSCRNGRLKIHPRTELFHTTHLLEPNFSGSRAAARF